ncbi:MAG: ATP-binding protein [Clostridiales bacterium]|jgi:Cdc6-like AAA superfamily ATPase|nr:ATP-binding protein [Clostridiales bacterium]
MVKLIVGPKGTGKTKSLVELVRQAVDKENGSVVCLEKERNLTYDIPYTVRLIHVCDYDFGSIEFFKGFISGLHAANYDITHIFIDSLFKMFDEPDMEKVAKLLDELDAFGKKENINFTITATADPEKIADNIKKYC